MVTDATVFRNAYRMASASRFGQVHYSSLSVLSSWDSEAASQVGELLARGEWKRIHVTQPPVLTVEIPNRNPAMLCSHLPRLSSLSITSVYSIAR